MSLPKKKRSQSKKSRGGESSSKKPLIPKGHKYLGKAGNYHYTESATGTVYRGLGDSESSYRMEAMDKSVWNRPAGLTKKKAKAPKPKKRAPTKREIPTKTMPPRMAAGVAEEFKFQIDEALNSAAVGRIVKKARRSGLPKGHVQSIEAYAKSHRDGLKTPDTKSREERALAARASLIAKKERKSAKASKAQLDATTRKEKLAQEFQKKIDAASTHDEIDRIVRKAKRETYLSKAMRVDIENYGINAGRDLYGTPRYEKAYQKEIAKQEKERAVAQKRMAKNIAKQERQDKLAEDYKKRLDAATRISEIVTIVGDAHRTKAVNKDTFAQIEVYANNAEYNLQSIHSEKNIATAVKFKDEIRVASTVAEIDSILEKVRKSGLSKGHVKDIEDFAKYDKKRIAGVEKIRQQGKTKMTAATEAKQKVRQERMNDTGVETMKGFIKELRSKDEYNAIKNAKTLGEIEEALEKNDKYWDAGKLLTDKANLLDHSKAAGVAPSHSNQFQIGTGVFKDHQEVHGLSYDTFPKLPSFIEEEYSRHVIFVDDKGEQVATYGSEYVFAVLKATKDSDMLWFNDKDRPLVGVNQRTKERVVLAPRVERAGGVSKSRAKMKKLREQGLILNHKGGVTAGHKVVFTRRHQYIELPDGRAVELSANKANPVKDFDAAQEKGVWSVPLLDKLTSKQMYQYAFLTAATGRRGIGDMEFEARELKRNPKEIVRNDRRTSELAVKGLFEHGKKVTLKGKTGLTTKEYTTTIDGKTIQYNTKDIQAARAVFGKDVSFYLVKLPKGSTYSSNTIVADSPDGLAQIRIAGTTVGEVQKIKKKAKK